jgi:hypothetical protein
MLELHNKSMRELRDIAKQIGLPGVKAESMQALRARIAITLEPGIIDALTPPDLNPVQQKKREDKPLVMLTPDEVMAALEPFKGKIKLAFYDADGNLTNGTSAVTWAVKNGPAEDSGSLSVPLKWIRFKAQEIANARFPAVIKGEFDAVRNIPVLA